jgi:23S rRNA (guanosine2251-2'-O)-methyltransferase
MIKKNATIIYGKNSVLEALKANKRKVKKIFLAKNSNDKLVSTIVNIANSRGIAIQKINIRTRKNLLYKKSQGIIAEIVPTQYINLMQLIKNTKNLSPYPVLIISDGITDPHNLGAIIRNCVAFGVHGLILPKRRNVDINETVVKVSSGAVEHIYISKVVNINHSITILKQNGFFIIGTALGKHQSINKINFKIPIAIVLGNEHKGMHYLTQKYCDVLISVIHCNKVSSLNVSCALAIILYEISRLRATKLL